MSEKHQTGYMPYDRTGNRLLVKSQLGRNKPTNYNIPPKQFVYGQITPEDPEHANEVMYNWQYHNMSRNQNNLKVKDLIETNKQCLKSLLHTSSQFSGFRQSKTLYKTAREGTNLVPIRLPQQSHAYGKPLDLQDPIKLVIANNYGQDDKEQRHTFYAQRSQSNSVTASKLNCHITKNHKILKQATAKRLEKFNWNQKQDHWKLSKFTGVGFKVETRRPRAESQK